MKKCLAICIYLLLITAFLRFDIRLLFDARQLFLVVFGAALLYLPALGQKPKKLHFDRGLFGQNSLWASIIQTFVLLFAVLSEGQSREEMMMQTALACRPLLYGFCLWVVFSEDSFDMSGKSKKQAREEEAKITANTTGEAEKNFDNNTSQQSRNRQDVQQDCRVLAQNCNKEIQKQPPDESEKPNETGQKSQKFAENHENSDADSEITKKTPRECLASLGLTRREIEVALLAAANLSNAEIAAELFISETTVKKHLSNIYGKLGISKRGQIGELFKK